MQFNLTGLCLVRRKAAFFSEHKTLVFLMRAGFVYIVIGLFSMTMLFAHIGKSQSLDEIKVTIELKSETLPELFKKIQNQTSLVFGYRQQEIEHVSPLSLDKQTITVKALLDLVFTGTDLQYKQVNTSVIVFEQEPAPALTEVKVAPITGIVKDKSGSPMPGVSIFIKGTNTGTVTNAEGKFSIDAKPEDVLVFTFIGYKKTEEQVGSRAIIDLVLEEDTSILDEVVINGGYYNTTDELKTGNIVKITAKEIENQPVTSPLMALQGRVAGLDITPTNGTPGNAPEIRIRGNNSLRQGSSGSVVGNGNYPLYVVDGVQIDSSPLRSFSGSGLNFGGYDPLSTINPSNIASIEILKDGDATAVYGSRGANGVILITTKQNKNKSEHTNLDVKFSTGVGRIAHKVDLLNTQQYVEMRKEALKNDGYTINGFNAPDLVYWDTTRYTDWQDKFLRGTSNITDLQGSISGGNGNTSFTFGLGYHKETLVTPGDLFFHRGSGNLSINHTSRNKKFRASFSTNFGVDQSNMVASDFVGLALLLPPNAPALYDQNGDLNWEVHETTPGFPTATWNNPMAALLNEREAANRNLITSANLSYELLPGIAVSASFGLSDLTSYEYTKQPISSFGPKDYIVTGSANFVDTKRTSWIVEPKVTLLKTWGKHHVDFLAGTTFQNNTGRHNIIMGDEYMSDALLGSLQGAGRINIVENSLKEYKFISFYSRAGYNYAQKYLVNLTIRRDGSSRFGPNNRFGNFWSVGTAWIFTGEDFVKNALPFLSFGKIRASYGITGSDGVGDYQYYNLYNIRTDSYQGIRGFEPTQLYNPDFAWEETSKLEAAIELAFFDNRLGAEVSWYRNRSSNQLVSYPLGATAGFTSVLQNFNATVQNSGLEILLRSHILNSQNWNWNASFNISFPENKLIKFDGIENSPYAEVYKVGEPTSIQQLYIYTGIDPETGLYTVKDKNNDGEIRIDDDRYLAKPLVKSPYGGLINTVQYKNLEISFNLYFARRDIARVSGAAPGSRYNQPVSVLNRWQKPGDITDIQRYGVDGTSYAHSTMELSDFNIIDGSFIRLKSLSIGYSLQGKWIERVKLQQAKLFIEGLNLFTITKYKGLDPETGPATLPPLQMITLGVQLRL